MATAKLTAKQALFCKEYITDFNATRAAKAAGYSKKTAYSIGQENLNKPELQNEIRKLIHKRNGKIEITQERILNELAILGFSNIEDYYEIDESGQGKIKTFEQMPDGAARAIREIKETRKIIEKASGKKEEDDEIIAYDTIQYKLHDKIKPLIALGTHTGLNLTRISINGKFKGTFKLEGSMKDFEDNYDKFATSDTPKTK